MTDPALLQHCGFSDCAVSSGDDAGDDPSVYLTTALTDALVTRAEAGSVVVLVQSASSDTFFKSERTNFKQACECCIVALVLCVFFVPYFGVCVYVLFCGFVFVCVFLFIYIDNILF